ncbi:hypothetical protein [Paenirhodobacter sp.]|jgi:hypothetical protein|uniref:hypothetical protein n=1 Tax=Paenirhodobacter sp. TaxID=1965326 RepID=UPI003B4FFA6C
MRWLLLIAALAGCASDPPPVRSPSVGVYRGAGGQVGTSVASGVGPVTVGVNNHGGGFLGTHLGPIHVGAGF